MRLIKHILLISIATWLVFSPAQANEKTLVLYNWENYMPQTIKDAFYEETGYSITEVYYDSDELKDELIFNNGGAGLDLIIGSGYGFISYVRKGNLLAQIPANAIPNKQHIGVNWLEQSPELQKFTTPLVWGTVGIIYRKDKIQNVDSWMDLYQPDPSLHKKIVMVDDIRDAMGSALIAQGYSFNSIKPKEIMAASKLLKAQREYVYAYGFIGTEEGSSILTDDVYMTLGYNGDAMVLQELSEDIGYVVPKEGTALWSDHIAVLASSQKKDIAFQFINFLNDPKRAAEFSEYTGSASSNHSALDFMDEAHKNNPLIYPPQELVEKSEFYQLFTPRTYRMYNTAYVNAKQ